MLPLQDEIREPLLVLIYMRGGATHQVRAHETYSPLADFFDLTPAERSELRPEPRTDRKWDAWVMFARQELKDQGFLDPSAPRGTWRLTPAGRQEAERLIATSNLRDHPRARFLSLKRPP
jgi:restriction endonuclease Mrr